MPRVTFGIPVLNQPEMLKETMVCIQNQTFTDWECIVVDDGSEVSHEPVVKGMNDPRFIFHRFPVNRGIPHGGNYLFKRARGEFINVLGCDERISPTKIAEQVAFLDANPNIAIVWGVPGNGPMGPVYEWEQILRKAHNRSREHWLKCFLNLEGVPVGGASALWRTSLFHSLGYFDEKLKAFSDHEWYCRVIEKYEVKVLPVRWMNEITIPGHVPVSRKDPERLRWELEYVRKKHPMLIPKTDGLVTVAMPVYNHARFIGESIKSVLAQTDQNFEILIMDDASTDDLEGSLMQFKDPRISFFKSEKNEGHMATVNKMLKIAKGDFFISFSADDTMSPDFIEKCRSAFKKDPFLEYVASQNDFMDENGKPYEGDHPFKTILKASNHTQEEWWQIFRQGNVYFGIGMYRTSALREVGGWEPEHGVISDYQMYLKLLPRYNFHIIEEPLTHTRIHGENQSLLNSTEARKLKRRYYEAQKPFFQPRARVIIATPFYELKGFSPYIASLLEVTRHLTLAGIDWQFMELSGDSYVHRARNSMCMNFLNDPYATDLFFIDSDMAWDPQSFINILYRPEPVIGGTYPVKNKWELWTSKPTVVDPEKDPHFVGHPLPDGSALIQANQLAGGFLRIKRSVLEKFMEYYPTHRYADSHPIPEMRTEQVEFFSCGINREPEINLLKEVAERMEKGMSLDDLKPKFEALKTTREFVGEDYCFSNRLREMGVPMFIYPNATISHYGVQGWTGNFNTFLRDKEAQGKALISQET